MIDYGEDKQSYGVPEIKVGPVSQVLTALYIGVFIFSFFMPEFARNFFSQVNIDLPGRFWTLLTGLFVFPESVGVYTQTPAGFWVIVTFMLIFFVVRPLEEKAVSKGFFILFLCLFMLVPALIVWGLAPKAIDPAATWPFWFAGASAWAFRKFRTMTFKLGEKDVPRKWVFAALALIPVIWNALHGNWSRTLLYAACVLLGVLWSVLEERKKEKR